MDWQTSVVGLLLARVTHELAWVGNYNGTYEYVCVTSIHKDIGTYMVQYEAAKTGSIRGLWRFR